MYVHCTYMVYNIEKPSYVKPIQFQIWVFWSQMALIEQYNPWGFLYCRQGRCHESFSLIPSRNIETQESKIQRQGECGGSNQCVWWAAFQMLLICGPFIMHSEPQQDLHLPLVSLWGGGGAAGILWCAGDKKHFLFSFFQVCLDLSVFRHHRKFVTHQCSKSHSPHFH